MNKQLLKKKQTDLTVEEALQVSAWNSVITTLIPIAITGLTGVLGVVYINLKDRKETKELVEETKE